MLGNDPKNTPKCLQPPYPPFEKKASWVPLTTRTNNKFSFFAFKKRSFRLKKVSCTCAPENCMGFAQGELDGWPVSQIGSLPELWDKACGKSMGFLSLSSRVACPQVVNQGYEDISMPTRHDVTQVLQQLECKFQASKMAWFSETVRWGLIQTASFTLSRHIPPVAQTLVSRMSWCQKEPPHFNGNTSLVGKLGWKLVYVDLLPNVKASWCSLLLRCENRCENKSPQQIVHSWNALLTKVYNVTIAILGNQNIIPMGFLEKKATGVTKHRQKPHRTVNWMAPEALMNQSCGCFLHTPKNPASQSPSHWQRKNGWAKQRFGSNWILTAHNIHETSFFKMLVDVFHDTCHNWIH